MSNNVAGRWRARGGLAMLAMALAVAGCTPAFNWREVALDAAGLRVLLPCKPDRGDRALPIGPTVLHVHMVGCEAGGALFAVAHAAVPDGLAPEDVAAAWRAALLAGMQAAPETPGDTGRRLRATGHRPDGSPVLAQAVWRVLEDRAPAQVVQAVVYSPEPLAEEVAETFLGGAAPR